MIADKSVVYCLSGIIHDVPERSSHDTLVVVLASFVKIANGQSLQDSLSFSKGGVLVCTLEVSNVTFSASKFNHSEKIQMEHGGQQTNNGMKFASANFGSPRLVSCIKSGGSLC